MAEQQQDFDPHMFTRPYQMTRSMRREVYDAISPSNPANSQKGKIIVVTGAGGGVGYRAVETFAQAGAAGIVLVGRSESTLQDAVKAAGSVPTLVVPTDLTNPDSVKTLFSEVKERFGKADVVVHAAGVATENLTFKDSDPNEYWKQIEVNTRGTFNVLHAYINAFDGQGTVVSTSSGAASLAMPGLSSYSVGKWAQIRMTEVVHLEQPALRAFALHPGILPIDEGRGMITATFEPFAYDHPTLAAGVILWMASGKSDFMRGGYMSVNWDVEELEQHKEEILKKELHKTAFLKGATSADGYAWES